MSILALDLLYLKDEGMRYVAALMLVSKYCLIPERYRNNDTLALDIAEELSKLNWEYLDKFSKAVEKHDKMVDDGQWEDSEEERWLRQIIWREVREHPAMHNTRHGRTLLEGRSLENFFINIHRILGSYANGGFFKSDIYNHIDGRSLTIWNDLCYFKSEGNQKTA